MLKLTTVLLLVATLVGCQQPNVPHQSQLQGEYNAAFQKMLDDPGNMDALLQYANVATRAGDYEGAISALERTLLINPELPRVQIELAVLYHRLRSYTMSTAYLQLALKSLALTPDLRKAAELLAAKSQRG